MSVQRSVALGYQAIGLIVWNNNIAVSSETEPMSVKMIDLDGHEIWSTSLDPDEQELFQHPEHLTTNVVHNSTTVIVTDSGMASIVLLAANSREYI